MSQTSSDLPSSTLLVCAGLLRDPASLGDGASILARHGTRLLAILVVCTAIVGAVVGSYRGGLQLGYAAVKLALLWLTPLLVALPAVRAAYRVCGIAASYADVCAAALVGSARAALLLAVASPIVWLGYSVHIDYHVAILVLCVVMALAGIVLAATMGALMPGHGLAKTLAHAMGLAALAVVFVQSGWVLRPFVVRPRADVAFLRPIESNAFASIAASWRSARGRYDGWDVRREGLLADPESDAPATPPSRGIR